MSSAISTEILAQSGDIEDLVLIEFIALFNLLLIFFVVAKVPNAVLPINTHLGVYALYHDVAVTAW